MAKKVEYRPNEAELAEDAKEMHVSLTHLMLGALIEPGRNPETFCRSWIRTKLDKGGFKRVITRHIFAKALKEPSTFLWCRHMWKEFLAAKLAPTEPGGVIINFDEPVRPNV